MATKKKGWTKKMYSTRLTLDARETIRRVAKEKTRGNQTEALEIIIAAYARRQKEARR